MSEFQSAAEVQYQEVINVTIIMSANPSNMLSVNHQYEPGVGESESLHEKMKAIDCNTSSHLAEMNTRLYGEAPH